MHIQYTEAQFFFHKGMLSGVKAILILVTLYGHSCLMYNE